MAESNVTAAIDNVVKKGADVIDGFDLNVYDAVQPWLNKLYSGRYSEWFASTLFGIPVANLIAAVLVFLFFMLLRRVFSSIIVATLLRFAKRSRSTIDDMIIRQLRGPFSFFFIIVGVKVFFELIFRRTDTVSMILNSMMIFWIFWVLYAITPITRELMYRYGSYTDHLSYELTNFFIRILRVLLVFFGVVAVLYNFGVNVTAFFASLGIGGLALALAAKDTAANLFGSVALLIDHSVKVGEWIKVDGVEGTVEDIGMRTTKIRTFEKSLIAIPNSIVATSKIENYSRRGIRRIKMTVGLTYGTTRSQIEAIIDDLREMLAQSPNIAQSETQIVNFRDFNASDLGILVYAFARTSEWNSYLDIRQEINLEILRIVQAHGASFAFPSQSLYLEQWPPETAPQTPTDTKSASAPTHPRRRKRTATAVPTSLEGGD